MTSNRCRTATLPILLSLSVATIASSDPTTRAQEPGTLDPVSAFGKQEGGTPVPPVADTCPEGYDPELWAKAWRVHHEALVLDTHSDTTSRILDEDFDMGPEAKDGHMDLPRIARGGLDAQVYAIYVSSKYFGDERSMFGGGAGANEQASDPSPNGSSRRALDMIDGLFRTVAANPDRMTFVHDVAGLRRAHRQGIHAAMMGIEGGHAIEGDLGLLRLFHRLGVRYMTLTHSNHNHFADSSGETPPLWNGLNMLGVKVVEEMNRIGMLVDVSHVSDSTFFDVLAVTRAPVICSHSSARALAGHPRNVTDDMLLAIKANRGVVMVNFNCGFLSEEYDKLGQVARDNRRRLEAAARKGLEADSDELKEALEKLRVRYPAPAPPGIDILMAHIFHIIKIAGIDCIGLGSDYDGVPCVPTGVDDVSYLPRISYWLMHAGYDEIAIRKVLGENFARVLSACEEKSRALSFEAPRRNDPATDFEAFKR